MTILQRRVLAVVSMVLVLASFVAYSFYNLGYYAYCAYNYKYFYIYADAFGWGLETVSCANTIKETAGNIHISFLLIALIAAFFLIMTDEVGKKIFMRFIKFYIPVALIILVFGIVSSFCLMWSCSDGLTPAMQFDGLLFLIITFTVAWRVLMPVGKEKFAFMFLLLIPVALYYGYNKLVQLERKPVQSLITAVESLNADICPGTSVELKQSCLEQIAIGRRDLNICSKISDPSHGLFCANAVTEQVTIDTLDASGCSKIKDNPTWVKNCNERMQDKTKPISR